MRLIDANTLKGEFTGSFTNEYPTALVHALIDLAPTIDAVQVVHGKWIEQPLKKYPEQYIPVCSVCEWKAFGKYNFCPHCGATMDGDE